MITPSGERVAVYIGNQYYYGMMSLAAKSLLSHTPVDTVYFLIDDDTFPEPLPPFIHCINVNHQTYFPEDGPNITQYYSYITLMRSVLSKILPQHDRVLLLDPDTIVFGDISPVWHTDISNAFFAAVRESVNNSHGIDPYFNAGIMLMNLSMFRNYAMDDRIIRILNTTAFEHLEQDALNSLCAGHIKELPPTFGCSQCTPFVQNPLVRHFMGNTKVLFKKYAQPYTNVSWDHIVSIQNNLRKVD